FSGCCPPGRDGSTRTVRQRSVQFVMADGRSTMSRMPSLGEEIANCVSHGVGFVAALVATPFLVVAAARRGDSAAIVGASVFAGTTAVLYLASTLYHALPRNKAKYVFRVIDHSAIFLLIAGTYTP